MKLRQRMCLILQKKEMPERKRYVCQMADYLGRAMSHIAAVVNPQAFIIGGGVSKAGQYLIDACEKYIPKDMFLRPAVKRKCIWQNWEMMQECMVPRRWL